MEKLCSQRLVNASCPCIDKLVSQIGVNVVLKATNDYIILLVYEDECHEWYILVYQSVKAASGLQEADEAFSFGNVAFVDEAIEGYGQLDENTDFSVWAEIYENLKIDYSEQQAQCECASVVPGN